jgi:hypothetical protein
MLSVEVGAPGQWVAEVEIEVGVNEGVFYRVRLD